MCVRVYASLCVCVPCHMKDPIKALDALLVAHAHSCLARAGPSLFLTLRMLHAEVFVVQVRGEGAGGRGIVVGVGSSDRHLQQLCKHE